MLKLFKETVAVFRKINIFMVAMCIRALSCRPRGECWNEIVCRAVVVDRVKLKEKN